MNEEKITLSITFENDLAKQFTMIKKYYCLENSTEVIRILIQDKFRHLFPKEA